MPRPREDTGNVSGSDGMKVDDTATSATGHGKDGILVCLPKLNGDYTPGDYRPISLLTTEYKPWLGS